MFEEFEVRPEQVLGPPGGGELLDLSPRAAGLALLAALVFAENLRFYHPLRDAPVLQLDAHALGGTEPQGLGDVFFGAGPFGARPAQHGHLAEHVLPGGAREMHHEDHDGDVPDSVTRTRLLPVRARVDSTRRAPAPSTPAPKASSTNAPAATPLRPAFAGRADASPPPAGNAVPRHAQCQPLIGTPNGREEVDGARKTWGLGTTRRRREPWTS